MSEWSRLEPDTSPTANRQYIIYDNAVGFNPNLLECIIFFTEKLCKICFHFSQISHGVLQALNFSFGVLDK